MSNAKDLNKSQFTLVDQLPEFAQTALIHIFQSAQRIVGFRNQCNQRQGRYTRIGWLVIVGYLCGTDAEGFDLFGGKNRGNGHYQQSGYQSVSQFHNAAPVLTDQPLFIL